jgi:hypothetical protein
MYLWAIMVAFFGLIRALIGVFNTKDPEFIQFTFYGFIYILALLPLRIYALATVWKTNWR